jgi:hypothetical protein
MAANNRIRRDIQYVEHTEGDGGEMLGAAIVHSGGRFFRCFGE